MSANNSKELFTEKVLELICVKLHAKPISRGSDNHRDVPRVACDLATDGDLAGAPKAFLGSEDVKVRGKSFEKILREERM